MDDVSSQARRRGPVSVQPPVSVGLAPPALRLIFRGSPAAAGICGAAFGCALPLAVNRAQQTDGRASLCLGPDEWLLLGPDVSEAAALIAPIEAALGSTAHALVDVSHRQVGVDVAGARAAILINAGCPLDLAPHAFPIGMAARTVLAKTDITLWRRGGDRFHIEVNRSFAPYLLQFLREADDGAF